MTLYFQTMVKHGTEEDGVVEYAEGSKVPEGDFDDELLEHWQESGTVAEHPPVYDEVSTNAEIAARDKEIEELKKALAQARGEDASDGGEVSPQGGTQAAADGKAKAAPPKA